MAGLRRHNYPPDDELEALVERVGSTLKAAQHLGFKPPTLDSYVDTQPGLRKKLADARSRHLMSKRNPQAISTFDEREVSDPDRIREDQREAEVKHLRRENRQLREEYANREATVERIIEASRVPVVTPRLKAQKQTKALPIRSVVLPIFDLQYGQLVQSVDTPLGVGKFDSETIFDQRLTRYHEAVTGIISDYATSHHIRELVFALGGDFVEGADIFAGQAWQLDKDPARQVWDLATKFEKAMRSLIAFAKEEIGVEEIGVYGVPGNHGKVGGRKAGAIPSTMSWDWLWLKIMEDKLRAEPIDQWGIEPGGKLLFECAGCTFLMVHGDEIKGWGGLPFYGLTKFDGRAIRMAKLVYDYCLLGHHHQPAEIPNGSGGEFIVSGDWVGANNLSGQIMAASRPQQRVLFFAEKWGLDHGARVYFEERDPNVAHVYGRDVA